ncbi:MAG TPA: hypothetical protein VGM98_05675 [Schlesneria sp.]
MLLIVVYSRLKKALSLFDGFFDIRESVTRNCPVVADGNIGPDEVYAATAPHCGISMHGNTWLDSWCALKSHVPLEQKRYLILTCRQEDNVVVEQLRHLHYPICCSQFISRIARH